MQKDETILRVWRINECDWAAGPTLLSAVRAMCRERGYHWSEVIDRDCFEEIPQSKWSAVAVFDGDDPDKLDGTIATIVAKMSKPGLVMSTEW